MNREVHVRFWERPEVKALRATRQSLATEEDATAALHDAMRSVHGS